MGDLIKTLTTLMLVIAAGAAQTSPISGQGTWETSLHSRDFNGDRVADAFYDADLDITWLAHAGLFAGTWSASVEWASTLNVFGVTGWRMPSMDNVPDDCGWAPVSFASEWRHMFHITLGNGKSCTSVPALQNTGPFTDLAADAYWSGTEHAIVSTAALDFFTHFGQGSSHDKEENFMRAWAVHNGDVGYPIPEPATLPLISAALLGLAAIRRSQRVITVSHLSSRATTHTVSVRYSYMRHSEVVFGVYPCSTEVSLPYSVWRAHF